ncbi:MAG: hypothetical protein B6U97_01535 [Candidatus Altiarchaeales archaeon ex4484_96]|nr:MAG: hypothetical protein B6U97_01535 [Candidatus Altiarchaeales archaeon ex4484_96]
MIEDYFKLAIDGIKHRKLRTGLTMMGVFVGIIAVVALISLGQGLQNLINEQFESVGGDKLSVIPGGEDALMAGVPGSELVSAKLHESDLEVIERVRGVDKAAGTIMSTGIVEICGKKKVVTVFGIPTEPERLSLLKELDYFQIEEGRYLKQGDKYKAHIAAKTCDVLDEELDVGDKLTLEGHQFDIVGKNKETGTPVHDQKISIPLETAQDVFNKTDEYSMISIKIDEGADINEVEERIEERLRKHRDVEEGKEDFAVESPQSLLGVFLDIINMVTLVLAGIAGISLIVGGIGIMTTMYTSVLERTRQIGIMKSVGARNSDILLMFVIEAGLLGLVGGVIGVILGILLSLGGEYLVRMYIVTYSIYVSSELVVGAIMFSFLIGCISGYFPAKRASEMKPVDALRYR